MVHRWRGHARDRAVGRDAISTSGLPAGCYWLHYLPGGTYYSAHQLAIRIDTSAPVITLSPASTYPGGVMSVSGAVEPGSPGARILLKEGRKEVPIYSGSVNPWGQFTIDGVTIPANAPLGNTLEHIMPKDPENLVHTEEFKRDYLHNLGNLVLNDARTELKPEEQAAAGKGGGAETHVLSHPASGRGDHPRRRLGESQIAARKKVIVRFAMRHWRIGTLAQ